MAELNNDFFRPYLRLKWCWDNGYFVEIMPTKKRRGQAFCKLRLVIQKGIIEGKEEYKQSSDVLANKIQELYNYMYENFKKNQFKLIFHFQLGFLFMFDDRAAETLLFSFIQNLNNFIVII